MNIDLLFESIEERTATGRVLAAFNVKSINASIDSLITEVLDYASEIDNILDENSYPRRYLNRVSTMSENKELILDDDLMQIDFRVREVIEDKIKRINTRIALIYEQNLTLKQIEQTYSLDDIDLEKEIETAKLNRENFVI